MSADPTTPLAQRLVQVASIPVWRVSEAETPEQIDALAAAAVVAVLRELAADQQNVIDGCKVKSPKDCGLCHRALSIIKGYDRLADSIEKGETGAVNR